MYVNFQVLVSMLLELAPSIQVADLMAEFFHDSHDAHPELQERLDKILADWQVRYASSKDHHANKFLISLTDTLYIVMYTCS